MEILDDYFNELFEFVINVQISNISLLSEMFIIINKDMALITRKEAVEKFKKKAKTSLIGLESGLNWIQVRKNFLKNHDQKETLNTIQTYLFEAKKILDSLFNRISVGSFKPTVNSIENRDQEIVLNIENHLHDIDHKVDNTNEIQEVINQTKKAINTIDLLFE